MIFHDYLTLLIPGLISFFVTLITLKFLMGYLAEAGIVGIDHNKKNKPTIPSGIGLALSFGFTVGILSYAFGGSIGLYTPIAQLTYIFAAVLSLLLITIVGFLDDINVRRVMVKTTGMNDTRKGLKQWQKPILTFIGAIPLMALIGLNPALDTIVFPFIGPINFGIIYPLIILPLAIIFGANAYNLLEGFNGIASGSGVILCIAFLLYSLFFGSTTYGYTGALLSAIMLASLIPIFLFNKYPAKVLPGDGFTYGVGAGMIIIMALGNMELFGVVLFMPWIIEFILHALRKFDVTDLGILQSDGTFKAPYGKKIYSLTHFVMNLRRSKEWEVSIYIWAIVVLFVFIGFGLKLLLLFP